MAISKFPPISHIRYITVQYDNSHIRLKTGFHKIISCKSQECQETRLKYQIICSVDGKFNLKKKIMGLEIQLITDLEDQEVNNVCT